MRVRCLGDPELLEVAILGEVSKEGSERRGRVSCGGS